GGVAHSDDLPPAADDRGLDEAELAEGRSAGLPEQVRDGADALRARRHDSRLLPSPARFGHATFHLGREHGIGRPCPPMPRALFCVGMLWISGGFPGAPKAAPRPIPIACGF